MKNLDEFKIANLFLVLWIFFELVYILASFSVRKYGMFYVCNSLRIMGYVWVFQWIPLLINIYNRYKLYKNKFYFRFIFIPILLCLIGNLVDFFISPLGGWYYHCEYKFWNPLI